MLTPHIITQTTDIIKDPRKFEVVNSQDYESSEHAGSKSPVKSKGLQIQKTQMITNPENSIGLQAQISSGYLHVLSRVKYSYDPT